MIGPVTRSCLIIQPSVLFYNKGNLLFFFVSLHIFFYSVARQLGQTKDYVPYCDG